MLVRHIAFINILFKMKAALEKKQLLKNARIIHGEEKGRGGFFLLLMFHIFAYFTTLRFHIQTQGRIKYHNQFWWQRCSCEIHSTAHIS